MRPDAGSRLAPTATHVKDCTMSSVGESIVRGIGIAIGVAFGAVFALFMITAVVFVFAAGIGAGMARAGGTTTPDGVEHVFMEGRRGAGNKLLAVRVDGVILGAPTRDVPTQFFRVGITYGYQVRRALEDAARNDDVKGVLLHVQTPGGTIFGSRAIHEGVMAVRKANKPVIAYIEGLSASGGVMATAGADRIFADHGSFIGSVGVLGPMLIFYNRPVAFDGGLIGGGITTEGGIEQTVIMAGRGKDLGNPFRRPTPDEVASLQRGVENEYGQFVQHVATHRGIDETVVREEMGAHIFGTDAARALRLIDDTLDQRQSLAQLAEMAQVGEDYQLVRPRFEQATLFGQLFGVWLDRPAARVAEPARGVPTLDAATCEAILREPLVYHGDPRALCR
jgi:protease IV